MLKPNPKKLTYLLNLQPPSGGCVLKLCHYLSLFSRFCQPPSGGCVLKRYGGRLAVIKTYPAAFGRLCVETSQIPNSTNTANQPPSGGCVLKHQIQQLDVSPLRPAAFGRLCVET